MTKSDDMLQCHISVSNDFLPVALSLIVLMRGEVKDVKTKDDLCRVTFLHECYGGEMNIMVETSSGACSAYLSPVVGTLQ